MSRSYRTNAGRRTYAAAALLALLGLGLLAGGCLTGGSTLSGGDIASYCETACKQGYELPRDATFVANLAGGCEGLLRRHQSEAEAVGCGPAFDVYFRCPKTNIDTCLNTDGCANEYHAINACGLRHDPNSDCVRAKHHVADCGVLTSFWSYAEVGLCSGRLKCFAGCYNPADCAEIRRSRDVTSPINACMDACIVAESEVPLGALQG